MTRPQQTASGVLAGEQVRTPRAIEIGFPIVEINRLAEPERNSFKPIYQMHKWFARRASCVFRAILLGSLKPAYQPDGTPTDLMAEFYKNHADDPDTVGKLVFDPFMGGGTTVVEALRLGCRVVGIDLNPVAWFVVKTEIEPVDLDALRAAFERLTARPVAWNGGKALRETLLDLYKTEVAPGVEADVIYTFWVKHAICTDPNCKREVALFKDWFIARRTMKVRHYKDALCPACKKSFSWELENASLIADPALMVVSPQDRTGVWAHAPPPRRKKDPALVSLKCPHCRQSVQLQTPWAKKAERKSVDLAVLLCPECEAVWQYRGPLPDGKIQCPACNHSYDPNLGNVPDEGTFQCRCGNRDKIINSIRQLPHDRRLSERPYALQSYLAPPGADTPTSNQASLFESTSHHPLSLDPERTEDSHVAVPPGRLLLPENGRFFTRFSPSDQARLQRSEKVWEVQKSRLPYPKSTIPGGHNTNQMLKHNYRSWDDMFCPRQLLALSALLQGILAEPAEKLREALLCAFSDCVGRNNTFCRYFNDRNTIQEIFSGHVFQPKVTFAEGSVFGDKTIRGTYPQMFGRLVEGISFNGKAFDWRRNRDDKPEEVFQDVKIDSTKAEIRCADSAQAVKDNPISVVHAVTDPPYVGNVNYSELADFYYVWLRLGLKQRYSFFAPETTPKTVEIVENKTRGKSRADFYAGLALVFHDVCEQLPSDGLLVFTFHHTDAKGTVWEGLLQSLCDSGYELAAVYPIHGEKESSTHLSDKENVSYDLIHVCRKRKSDPEPRSWAGIRQELRRRARAELAAIEAGRYGGQPLSEPDVRLICIGKCLELYSAHYDKVLNHEGMTLPLHQALQDIASIVDQLVTRERPLPPELEDIDALSYAWLRLLALRHTEIGVDKLSKGLRAMQVTIEDFKAAGLLTRGRAGRGRSYEVKQPRTRLELALERLEKAAPNLAQGALFAGNGASDWGNLNLVDLLHVLMGLAEAGESVVPIAERFESRRAQIVAGLRFVRNVRPDWHAAIDRVLAVMEGAPLLRGATQPQVSA